MRTVRIIQKFAAPLCVAAALVLSPVAAFAQEIVTINIQSILSDSAAAKSAKSQIDSKRNQYQNELKKSKTNCAKKTRPCPSSAACCRRKHWSRKSVNSPSK